LRTWNRERIQETTREASSRAANQNNHPDWELIPIRIMVKERARTTMERENSKAAS
jgi:hypothetical protein